MFLILSYNDKILNWFNIVFVPNRSIQSVKIEYNVPNLKGTNQWQSHTKRFYLKLRNPCINLRLRILCSDSLFFIRSCAKAFKGNDEEH